MMLIIAMFLIADCVFCPGSQPIEVSAAGALITISVFVIGKGYEGG